jgi:hypothetical protein
MKEIFEHRVNGETLARFELEKDYHGIYKLKICKESSEEYQVVNPNSDSPVAFLEDVYLLLWTETYLIMHDDIVLLLKAVEYLKQGH